MNKDAGVRWLTLSKAAIGDKQQNKQHHYGEFLLLETMLKQDKVLLLHKLEVSGFKILRKKVLASYFIVVVAGHFLCTII